MSCPFGQKLVKIIFKIIHSFEKPWGGTVAQRYWKTRRSGAVIPVGYGVRDGRVKQGFAHTHISTFRSAQSSKVYYNPYQLHRSLM